VVSITNGGDFARRIGFAVPLTGIETTCVVRCDQPRVLDLDARNGRKVETLPPALLDEVMARIAPVIRLKARGTSRPQPAGIGRRYEAVGEGLKSRSANAAQEKA
jgi:hypothetical protein